MRKLSGAARPPKRSISVGDPFVGFVAQHLLDDFQRGVVGVAAAVDEAGLEPGRIHRPADGRSAAVDHHGPHADRFHEDDVDQQVPQGGFVFQHAAAELDDRDLVAELANPAQGFDQHVGFLSGGQLQALPGEERLSGYRQQTTGQRGKFGRGAGRR